MMKFIAKGEVTPLKMEHMFIFIFGICCIAFANATYDACSPVGKVVVLIVYLGLLVGVAPIPMPVFKSKFMQVMFAGLFSGVLDSFIVLEQCKHLRTVEDGQDRDAVMAQTEDQPTEGVRARLMSLMMIAAIIGGLIIWFGEVYAAGTYQNDHRTGLGSAFYIVPPVLIFLSVLGLHANTLKIEVVPNENRKGTKRDIAEFGFFIGLLLYCHNPILCLGALLAYSVTTRQDDQLLEVWKHHTEVNVMLVLLIALLAGEWIVEYLITPTGMGTGSIWPIIPAAIQAVLWGPIYEDPTSPFWIKITTLSTGALLLPTSSLVGVMLFPKLRQWGVYMKYSFGYALLWYLIMRGWIWLTWETPVGNALETWAHVSGHH